MEEREAKIINFEKICRLCLLEKRVLTEIFESCGENNEVRIDQKIMACAAIDLCKDDGLPSKICIKCLASVNAALDFRIQCENADKTLHDIQKLLNTNQVNIEEENVLKKKINPEAAEEKGELKPRKTIDLSHVIVIKKQEKKINNEASVDLLQIINDSDKDIKSKKIALADVVISNNQEEIASHESLDSSLCIQETRSYEDSSNEISFTIQGTSQQTYRVIINPPGEEESLRENDSKVKCIKKGVENIRKSPCPFCNKMLARVDEHIRLLHRNRVYICTKHNCGAEFLTLKNLQSHQLRCYNMEKAYKCFRCFKEFHRKSNYKAHIRRHSNIKDFQCQLCERAFVDSTGLRRHFLKHHEPQQETFVSGCCGKRFKSKEGLKKHIQRGICGIQMFHVLDSSNEPIEISAAETSEIIASPKYK